MNVIPLRASEDSAEGSEELPEQVSFEDFWRAYPRKCAKKDARKAWEKIEPALYPAIIAAIAKHKISDHWRRDEGRYIPYPATYLNGERWEDELDPVTVVDKSCRRVISGKEICGMPGNPHPVHGYSCDHCNRKESQLLRNRQEMPAHVKAALSKFRRQA